MTNKIKRAFLIAAGAAAMALAPLTASAEAPVWTKGEVTKIDTEQGKVTVRHEEITNLDMPAMRMIFQVADPEILANLQVGETKEFYFVDENGRMMIRQVR